MSTGKRLAKRSIVGTRVCAPGKDGKYYCGSIRVVKSPSSNSSETELTSKTRYTVTFDKVPGESTIPESEFLGRELIGPGFGSITNAKLKPGQKVYLTYNGREINAVVSEHNIDTDEVHVVIAPSGQAGQEVRMICAFLG